MSLHCSVVSPLRAGRKGLRGAMTPPWSEATLALRAFAFFTVSALGRQRSRG